MCVVHHIALLLVATHTDNRTGLRAAGCGRRRAGRRRARWHRARVALRCLHGPGSWPSRSPHRPPGSASAWTQLCGRRTGHSRRLSNTGRAQWPSLRVPRISHAAGNRFGFHLGGDCFVSPEGDAGPCRAAPERRAGHCQEGGCPADGGCGLSGEAGWVPSLGCKAPAQVEEAQLPPARPPHLETVQPPCREEAQAGPAVWAAEAGTPPRGFRRRQRLGHFSLTPPRPPEPFPFLMSRARPRDVIRV